MVDQFNELCPIGSPVIYWPGFRGGEGRKSTTRSGAWLLGGHTPVVMVEGYPGGIALAHVMPYADPKQVEQAKREARAEVLAEIGERVTQSFDHAYSVSGNGSREGDGYRHRNKQIRTILNSMKAGS